jgi:transcriptional regulator GlxA family with amidase domain
MTWALGHLDRPLPVAVLARQAGMSRRNFDRRFRQITGTAPAAYRATFGPPPETRAVLKALS